MKSSDRSILLGIAILGVLAAFWFLVLSPKREEANELSERIEQTQQEVAAQQAIVNEALAARDTYEVRYRSLVELGKAAPSDSDTSSMIVQIESLADRADVSFSGLTLEQRAAAAPTPAAQTTTDQNQQNAADPGTATPVAMATPTEATVSTLPLGATVGPAGLPVMAYSLDVNGDFFGVADFMASLDRLVGHKGAKLSVNGRLFTVNGFTMEPDSDSSGAGGPRLNVNLSLTSYLVPPNEGLTGGATPTAPATPTPTSDTVTP